MLVIQTKGLSKTFRGGWRRRPQTEALQNLNLEVHQGEVFGFLGPNGAGKTTTIHLLLNFIKPSAGAAFLFGCPVTDVEIRRRIGYLPESVNLPDYYRGKRLLEFFGALLDMPRGTRKTRAAELLNLAGLQDAGNKSVSKYSKGMFQRLGFAQALLNDPDLLILDEPTSSLDPVGRKEFRDILLEWKRRGKSIFISSHILSEVESVCDRVAILQHGHLLKQGTLQELSPATGAKIVVNHLPAEAIEAFSRTTVRLTMEGGETTIYCRDELMRQEAERILTALRVAVQRIETEARSLEEIFFSTINQADQP